MSKPEPQHTFTQQGRKVLTFAQEEAQHFQHHYIGTEHLLLGLIREGGLAARLLLNYGANLHKTRSTLEFIIGRGDRIVLGEIQLTPHGKNAVEFAAEEAQQLRHEAIGPEHLLLGLLHDYNCIAVGMLESLGASPKQIRELALATLQAPNRPEAAALVPEGKPFLTCPRCGSRCPEYFYYCYNCGQGLAQV